MRPEREERKPGGNDLLGRSDLPLTVEEDGETGGYNLNWQGTRAGFMDRTRNGRLEMLLILEHPDGTVIQHSATHRNREEAIEALRNWMPTRDGKQLSAEEAHGLRAAFKH